jgi:two-component system response regulator FixJ
VSDSVIVHVVDDEPAVRKSMAYLLSASGYAVQVHESAAAFLEAQPYPPGHCLVTDLRMPDIDGVSLLKRMRKTGGLLPTIVVTGHADVPMAVAAMKEGPQDFIEKPFDDAVLLQAIDRAVGSARDEMEQTDHDEKIRDRLGRLSARERQVLVGIIAGKSNKVIGAEHSLSPRTVEVYRANVMTKMQARSLPELIRMSLKVGLSPESAGDNA